MADRARPATIVEEYVERRSESAAGRLVWRHYRRTQWFAPPPARVSMTREVLDTAGPLLRAVAIALAPALGQMALRALAPRLRAALPGGRRPHLVETRPLTPLALPAPEAPPDEQSA